MISIQGPRPSWLRIIGPDGEPMLTVHADGRWEFHAAPTEAARSFVDAVQRLIGPSTLTPRPGWDDYFLGIADAVAARGECERSRVGAVLVRVSDEDGLPRIVATGYNGVRAGEPSCLDGVCPRARNGVASGTPYDPSGPGACIATHAEDNALSDALLRGMDVAGCTIYVTKEPCERCASLLAAHQVRPVWRHESPI